MQAALTYLVPVAMVASSLVLSVGIFAMSRSGHFNRNYSNLIMHWRVLLQFIAICLIALASLLAAR